MTLTETRINGINIYKYEFTIGLPIPGFIIRHILGSSDNKVVFDFDLNVAYEVEKKQNNIFLIKLLMNNKILRKIEIHEDIFNNKIDDNSMYIIMNNNIYKAEIFLNNTYTKLYISSTMKSSTLNINGIHMHQVVKISPYKDSERKAYYAKIRRGDRVLDICTGLGYTAIAALQRGASSIVTIEIGNHVLSLAEVNPWSFYLGSDRITIINNDALDILQKIRDNVFDKVIHDPPRFNIAGELYSLSFYKEIYRVLKPGGLLFHYTGQPLKHRGRGLGPIIKGIKTRLQQAGFIVLRYIREVYGFVAVKPR